MQEGNEIFFLFFVGSHDKLEHLSTFGVVICTNIYYNGYAALFQSGNGEEVCAMDILLVFIVSVAANVVSDYVSKWLDRHGKGQ